MLSKAGCIRESEMSKNSNTTLHSAARSGDLDKVRMLISEFKVDINARDAKYNTPLHVAAWCGKEDVAYALIGEFNCDVNVKGCLGRSLLHSACIGGNVSLVKTLILKHKADINARDAKSDTPLHVAAWCGKEEVAYALIDEFHCDVNVQGGLGRSLLHDACNGGNVSLVKTLILKHKADINARDAKNNTPIHVAALGGEEDVAYALIDEFNCDVNVKGCLGLSLLHSACHGGNVGLVKTLILKHKADINARDAENDTPLHVAALAGKEDVAYALIDEFNCDVNVKGCLGRSLLHSACIGGNVGLVKTLILKHKADINARDAENDTPLHVAALAGKEDVAYVLIDKFHCDVNVKGGLGRSLLHKACDGGNVSLVKTLILKHKVSMLEADSNGSTPLHLCAYFGNAECLKALLLCNAPIMIRNNMGKTPRDVANARCKSLLDDYRINNQDAIYLSYDDIKERAKKKYSSAEHITRIFVIGNPGAGKSTLVETLKREGFFQSLWRVSESSVPPHTAGIVPSIHTSKHYGRVLFYDFAGDPEYYSSHAAILVNLVSLRNGDNMFVIVVDLREDNAKTRSLLSYWYSFIQHQKFAKREPSLILIGSHLDQISSDKVEGRSKLLKKFCDTFNLYSVSHFMLDCCKPSSNEVVELQKAISGLTKGSPHYILSFHASILLGLVEKDFSNVTAISVMTLQTHIEDTGIHLPTEIQPLYSILHELHEIGFLFIVNDIDKNNLQIVLNISQLTEVVHKSLFSKESRGTLREMCETHGTPTSMNIGVIPQSVLSKILPEYITMECLVQLQYCQQISYTDVGVFPSLTADSANQSFLFFPALCSVDKSDVSWVTPPDLGFSIGCLGRCTNPCDYFPPRFLHVLLLRLIFRFSLPVPSQGSPEHSYFQHRCTMWKTGVHWLMEEGAECMVELVNDSKGVVVITKCKNDRAESCSSIFHRVLNCVMEAKAEFCHSIRPEFFLLDSTDEADYLSVDNLFAMSEVERALTHPDGKEVIVSVTGKKLMEHSKFLCMRTLTHWYSLFPIDFNAVLDHLANIVRDLYKLGLHLGIPEDYLML